MDSNLDWGQDLKHLADYVRERGIANVWLVYFGTAETAYYGLERMSIPPTWETPERQALDCVVAFSVTALYDVYGPPGYYAWLRKLRPFARIGYTIYLYDLRKERR